MSSGQALGGVVRQLPREALEPPGVDAVQLSLPGRFGVAWRKGFDDADLLGQVGGPAGNLVRSIRTREAVWFREHGHRPYRSLLAGDAATPSLPRRRDRGPQPGG